MEKNCIFIKERLPYYKYKRLWHSMLKIIIKMIIITKND